jgi:preprotein translocase subunit SecY
VWNSFPEQLRTPELRRRLAFTGFVLSVYRLGAWIPAPGVNSSANTNGGGNSALFSLLNLLSGSSLQRLSIFALGIVPYVTASIAVQLMTALSPRLEALQKEGEAGQARLNQITRVSTIGLATAQAAGYVYLFNKQGTIHIDGGRAVLIVITLVAGTTLLMWLGEQVTRRGIGNGVSILIFASILAAAPTGIHAWTTGSTTEKLFFPLAALGVLTAVVFFQEGQRRIPIQYARRSADRRQIDGGSTYMPLRVNSAGVVPVIFAAAILAVPPTLASIIPSTSGFMNRYFQSGGYLYLSVELVLILAFTFFYTAGRTGRFAASLRRLCPRNPAGAAHRALPRPGVVALDRLRRALPGERRRRSLPARPLRGVLSRDLSRARRYVGSHRRGSCPRCDAPDSVAGDLAPL